MMYVTFVGHILGVYFHDPAANATSLGIPTHAIANFECLRHRILAGTVLGCYSSHESNPSLSSPQHQAGAQMFTPRNGWQGKTVIGRTCRMSPLLAHSGHALVHCECPLSGVKRTSFRRITVTYKPR